MPPTELHVKYALPWLEIVFTREMDWFSIIVLFLPTLQKIYIVLTNYVQKFLKSKYHLGEATGG